MGEQAVPTVSRIGPYRFFFYSNERGEPAHVHVQRDKALAKFWLTNVSLAKSNRFPAHEIGELQRLVKKHHTVFMEAWNDHIEK